MIDKNNWHYFLLPMSTEYESFALILCHIILSFFIMLADLHAPELKSVIQWPDACWFSVLNQKSNSGGDIIGIFI